MQNLLQKNRRLNKVFQNAAGESVDFAEVAEVLQEIISADAFIISVKGEILGKAASYKGAEFPQDFNEALTDIQKVQFNVAEPVVDSVFPGKNTAIVPVIGKNQRVGTLLLVKDGKFEERDLVSAEFAATVVGMVILRTRADIIDEEDRNRAIVQKALNTLSYSEQEAVEHIFKELDGREGLLVASKIADRVGITRSVIVNALRKFESAGVIESRSLGMKGTFIKILNDQLLPELEKLSNR
jgi:transcriptional pleiotropic repressor